MNESTLAVNLIRHRELSYLLVTLDCTNIVRGKYISVVSIACDMTLSHKS